jgi:hypothetical protein
MRYKYWLKYSKEGRDIPLLTAGVDCSKIYHHNSENGTISSTKINMCNKLLHFTEI